MKDDPQSRVIKVPAMGIFHLVPGADFQEGLKGRPLIENFDVFLDGSEVWGIIEEVQKLRGEDKVWRRGVQLKSSFGSA